MKRAIRAVCLIIGVSWAGAFLPGLAFARGPVNKDANGIAIIGYDPVAYFKKKDAVGGKPVNAYKWG